MKNTGRVTLLHRVQHLAVILVAWFLRILPLTAAAAAGRGMGLLLRRLDRRHREEVEGRIRAVFPGAGEEHARRLGRDFYAHLGTMLTEFVRIPRLTRENLHLTVDWDGWDRTIDALLAEGKGIVFATGHIGNWEVCGAAFTLKGYTVGAVARPLANPLVDRWIRSVRQSSGQEIWEKWGVLRKVIRVLKGGGGLGILVDQDGGKEGLFLPFLGLPASTLTSPADLALLTGAPILVMAFQRTSPMRFVARGGRVLRPDPAAGREAERLRLMTAVNEDLEAIVRRAPEQWLWLHRRWRTRPPDAAAPPRPA